MIEISPTLAIDEREIQESFVRAEGPGGQNVNKVSTAVQLRFDVEHSPSLPQRVKDRLVQIAGSRMTKEGVLVIIARRFRTQAQNREDALEQLTDLLRRAEIRPKVHLKTRVPLGQKRQRREDKSRQGEKKKLRRVKSGWDE
ncbi:MAG: aminoacyl-tRNA hydrolase [Anaerolineaceae bacterium]|nr:aminoacyl-tRNA hydrolase [Anaerolineaceae bacterium]